MFGRLWRHLHSLPWRQLDWRDVASAVFLGAAFWYLVGQDGGKPLRALIPVLVLAVPVLVAAVRELERSSRFLGWMTAWWTLGPVLALAAADVRAGWVAPVAALSLAPPAFLAARHLLRRGYGGVTLSVILVASGARAWWEAFLAYWGGGGGNHWLALSWHNQSATLMGAVAILGFALAVRGRGWVRLLGLLVAGAGGSATWLAASRAGLATTLLGLGVAGVVAARVTSVRRSALAAIGVLVLSGALVVALGGLAHAPGTGAERLVERGLDRSNLDVRFDYWQGAWGMLREAPLTGTGPGSYRWSSLPHDSFGTSRVQSAHNEYLEVLASHGLLGGLPVWLVVFWGAWLVLIALGARKDRGGSVKAGPSLEGVGMVAGAGVLAHLGVHAGFDFDWDYPILLLAGAVALGALSVVRTPAVRTPAGRTSATRTSAAPPPAAKEGVPPRARWFSPERIVVGICLGAVALSLWGISVERGDQRPPWSLEEHLRAAWLAVQDDEVRKAEEILVEVERWNPGAPSLPAMQTVVAHAAGRVDGETLRSHGLRSPSMDERLNVAERLLVSGELEYAATVLDDLRLFIEERRRWQVRNRVGRLAWLSLELSFREGGCELVESRWQREEVWAAGLGIDTGDLRDRMPRTEGRALECEEHPLAQSS